MPLFVEWRHLGHLVIGSLTVPTQICIPTQIYIPISSTTSKLLNQPTHEPSPPHIPIPSVPILHTRRSTRLALHPPPERVIPFLLHRITHQPRRYPPPRRSRQNLPTIREPNHPADERRNEAAGELGERELEREEVGGAFAREVEPVLAAVAGYGYAGGEPVFVDVRDRGVVLGEEGEDDGSGSRGEVVDATEAERAEHGRE